MGFQLQMMRALIASHPDRAARLEVHADALEAAIDREPDRCLERVRALFEATCQTVAPQIGLELIAGEDFPAQNRRVIRALDFTIIGHPESDKIGEIIKRLVGSINGTIGALSELSNIPGLRHGGSLDWKTLERQHAVMLGGLCDTLVSFLFDVAWSRAADVEPEPAYEDFAAFNEWIDDEYEEVETAGSKFLSSKVLFSLDRIRYDELLDSWHSIEGEEAADA